MKKEYIIYKLSEDMKNATRIENELFKKFDVKRGLRNEDGTGVLVGLGYPGGPKIDKLAKEGNPDAIEFPRAKVAGSEYDFSFSGLKSSVLNYINKCEMKKEAFDRADLVASFQNLICVACVY